jgi:FMN phosphatase YigB (HAD superfamily)
MKTIIFDFNRTIYDPDSKRLIYGARRILELSIRKGYALCLVSQRENGREEILNREDIRKLFTEVFFVDRKDKALFQNILNKSSLNPSDVLVVGDRISAEIRAGAQAGCKTVWVQKGKFSTEKKCGVNPDFTIADICQLEAII